MLPSVLSPYLRKPNSPTVEYKTTTIVMPMLSTLGQPIKCCGVFMLFSNGIT